MPSKVCLKLVCVEMLQEEVPPGLEITTNKMNLDNTEVITQLYTSGDTFVHQCEYLLLGHFVNKRRENGPESREDAWCVDHGGKVESFRIVRAEDGCPPANEKQQE